MATWTKVVTESSSGNIGQNAATATALASAGTITFTGDVTGGSTPTYTGGGNLSIAMGIAANSVDGTHIALGSDASGDIMYYDGTNYVRLAKGTDGQVLKLASGVPSWAADTDTGETNQNAYSTITVPTGTTSQAADSATDTIAFTAAGGMTITGGADDTIEFSSANTNQLTTFNIGVDTNSNSTTIAHGETLTFAGGTGISTETTADGTVTITSSVTNTDVDVSVANLKTRLAGGFGSNAVTIGDSDDVVTIGNDLVVTGDLTVSGDTTTINTATLTVEDKMIKLADVSSPTTTTADAAGIQVETSGTEAEWPELKWAKDKGGSAATGAGLTGWTLSNHVGTSSTDWAISVMDFKSDAGAPTGDKAGIGTFSYNYADDELYIRTA